MKNYQQSVFTTFNMHNVLYFYKNLWNLIAILLKKKKPNLITCRCTYTIFSIYKLKLDHRLVPEPLTIALNQPEVGR